MSIYCTWLDIQHPDDWQAALAENGIASSILGDDSESRDLGSPWIYQGSHVMPHRDDPRGGWLEVGSIPNHVASYRATEDETVEDDPDKLAEFRVDFLRVGLGADDDRKPIWVVLDRAQVTELRDTLGRWLEMDVRW